jgi:hypothetical protein
MVYFTKLLFVCLSAFDPLIWLPAICFALGICFVAAFWELEQVRARWTQRRAMKLRSPNSEAVLRQRRRDRVN